MTKILVTGGCGFIGSNLIPILLAHGYKVRVLDNLSVGSPAALHGLDVELMVGDICDQQAVIETTRGVDGVVHLAAHTSVIDSQKEPLLDFEINARGTLNLLQACVHQGIDRFVFASSNAPIGETTPPIDESKPAHPLSPYGASKLAGEGYCTAFHGSFGLHTIVLRFANVYGPGSTHKGSVVAKFVKDAMHRRQLTIFGDGHQTRDFIYVDDLCRAISKGLQCDCAGEVFQIATGRETQILELAEMVSSAYLPDAVRVVHTESRPGEIIKNYSCIRKAQQILGWEPQVMLSEGLDRTIHWFRTRAGV
jgi:UDP-glucose 4-epimerase